ncbi:alpha/beta fold hydrolase [Shewanella sp. UCD-KL21]|uniref:alpha/beta fold hydrolase n=1 Tax=Shewanella sp. UCD-KL21 TaxID=1917164 RepID=UPI000970A4F7|nr:alpha/beta hydrolase [Shewanella sp. UCD-KL21]
MPNQSQTFAINEQPLHFIDQGQGPVILFIHGFLSDSQQWQPQIELFSQSHRCIAVDLWAHGQSGALPHGTTSLVTIAHHCLSLLAHLNIDQCMVIGNGCGGAIAAEMVLAHPKTISKLVLANSFIGFEPQVNSAKYQLWIDELCAAKQCSETLADTISSQFFAETADSQALMANFNQQLMGLSAQRIEQLSLFAPLVFYKRDSLELAEQFTLPCLILIGSQNKLRTPLEAYLMQDCISASKQLQISNAGHMCNQEQADEFNQLLHAFL